MDYSRGLYVDTVEAQWQPYGWDTSQLEDYGDGDAELWGFCEVDRCDSCGRIIEDTDDHADGCEYADWEPTKEGPMMNGYWPLVGADDIDMQSAARKLADLPLCIVRVGDQYGVALTGGGMDLSADIARAYIALGYLPPAALELPKTAGEPYESALLDIMRESYEIQRDWATQKLGRLADMVAWYAERAER